MLVSQLPFKGMLSLGVPTGTVALFLPDCSALSEAYIKMFLKAIYIPGKLNNSSAKELQMLLLKKAPNKQKNPNKTIKHPKP